MELPHAAARSFHLLQQTPVHARRAGVIKKQSHLHSFSRAFGESIRHAVADLSRPPDVRLDVNGGLRFGNVLQETIEERAVLNDLDGVACIDRPFGDADQGRQHSLDVSVAGAVEGRFGTATIGGPEEKSEGADQRDVPVESRATVFRHKMR